MKIINTLSITALILTFCGFNILGEEENKGPGKGKGGIQRPEFKSLDTNGDKKISRVEFAKSPIASKIRENRGKEFVDRIFGMRDKDGDGSINLQEFNTEPGAGKGKGGKGKGMSKGKGGPGGARGKGKGGKGTGSNENDEVE